MYTEQAAAEGVKQERERVISWLRWLDTAGKDPAAREALNKLCGSGKSTVGAIADSLQQGAHLIPRDL